MWNDCYHDAYPARTAFGGYKQSDIGRDDHKMLLDQHHQIKNMLVSDLAKRLGFF